jgi:hypothetical protein
VRNQDLVLPSDAVPAGTITKWEWRCHLSGSENKAGTYYNFKIRLCHTTLSQLTYNLEANYDGNTPVEVYARGQQYIYADPGAWFGWAFDKSFRYDGRKNLIVEVYWKDSDQQGQTSTYATAGTNRGAYDVNGSISVVNYWHHMRITVEGIGVTPTSLGRVKALYR